MKVRFWLNNIWTWKYVRYIFYYILSSDVFSRMTFFHLPKPYSRHWGMGAFFGSNSFEKKGILFACTP